MHYGIFVVKIVKGAFTFVFICANKAKDPHTHCTLFKLGIYFETVGTSRRRRRVSGMTTTSGNFQSAAFFSPTISSPRGFCSTVSIHHLRTMTSIGSYLFQILKVNTNFFVFGKVVKVKR